MDAKMSFPIVMGSGDPALAAINEQLAAGGLSISREDALTLAERRVDLLAEVDRIEFGMPAIVSIAEAIAGSPHISKLNIVDTLAELQESFYMLRGELPIGVPDDEIVEALSNCLDAHDGDAAMVAALPKEDLMAFSGEYRASLEAVHDGSYRIVDYEGRVYAFDPAEWEYDEAADGWEGERWADDLDD